MNPTTPTIICCARCASVVLDLSTQEARRHLSQGGHFGHLVDAEGAPICGLCLETQAEAEREARVERARGRALMRALSGPLADEP